MSMKSKIFTQVFLGKLNGKLQQLFFVPNDHTLSSKPPPLRNPHPKFMH